MTTSRAAVVAGVAGWPIAHSLSPALHTAWIRAAGLDAIYAPFAVAPESAAQAFAALPALGVRGVNVTIPLKESALRAADRASEAAQRAGAANLLVVEENGSISADNTDVAGFLAGLEHAAADPSRPAVILGAGGAARGAAVALMTAGWTRLRFVNRTREKAEALAEMAGVGGEALGWDQRAEAVRGAGLIVNATSLGMTGQPELELDLAGAADDAVVYDLVYAPLRTALLRAAEARGLATIDGLHMLIGQAAPSFERLFGRPPPADVDARAFLQSRMGRTE